MARLDQRDSKRGTSNLCLAAPQVHVPPPKIRRIFSHSTFAISANPEMGFAAGGGATAARAEAGICGGAERIADLAAVSDNAA